MGHCLSLVQEKDQCLRLRKAIKQDDANSVQKILSQGFDVDCPLDSLTGNTALILATCYGAARSLPLVLDFIPNLDVSNHDGRTALDKAILSYALAHNLCLHKLAEEQRRYFVLRVLVSSGCQKLNPKELELCIRMNEHDKVFLSNLIHVIKSSPGLRLKSSVLQVLITVDIHHSHVRNLLIGGATFDDFRRSWRATSWRSRRPLTSDMVNTLIRATSDISILQIMEEHYDCVMRSPRSPMPTSVAVLLFLAGYKSDSYLKVRKVRDSFYQNLLSDVVRDGPPSLKHFCRTTIRKHCFPNVYNAINDLKLPHVIRNYISFEHN